MARKGTNNNTGAVRRGSHRDVSMSDKTLNSGGSVDFGGRKKSTDAGTEMDYRELLRDIVTGPAAKYVAAGIATVLLTRLANKLSERYPEVSEFIRDNMEMLESRMSEYKSDFEGNRVSKH